MVRRIREREILDALNSYYGDGAAEGRGSGGDATEVEYLEDDQEDVEHLRDLASEAPVIRLVNSLIARALEQRASDIHIEPFEKELRIRYRIDGILHDIEAPPRNLQAAISILRACGAAPDPGAAPGAVCGRRTTDRCPGTSSRDRRCRPNSSWRRAAP